MEYRESSQPWPSGGGPLWLHPDDDLAPNRPGETLHGRLAALPAAGRRRLPGRLLRRGRPAEALRAALAAEHAAGAALDRLEYAGWRVLHSLPLPGAEGVSPIPHLAIGPGGVLSLRSVQHRGATLRVGTDGVAIGRRRSEPYVRHCRRDAARAAYALSRGCGFPVEVRPLLVCLAAARIEVSPALRDVEVLMGEELPGLAARGGVLKPDVVHAIHGIARDGRTWREA